MAVRWTVAAVLAAAKEYLDKNDFVSARLEAELLLAHSLRVSRVDLYMHHDRPLSDTEREAFKRLLKERLGGKPLQYITGSQPFRHLDLRVEPGVFIPRPETELLVSSVIDALKGRRTPLTLLELGAGSGAVCLSLAKELPEADVWAVDISAKSIAVTQANAVAHALEDKVTLRLGDMFGALPAEMRLSFDAIVANPPYVPTGEIKTLQPQVRDHEPVRALDGGETGIRFYEKIIVQAPAWLRPGGMIAFEVGIGQAGGVRDLLKRAGFAGIAVDKDYGGVERIVIGRRPSQIGAIYACPQDRPD